MLEEMARELARVEEAGATKIVIVMNPFFAKLYNIQDSFKGYPVQKASVVNDFKILF